MRVLFIADFHPKDLDQDLKRLATDSCQVTIPSILERKAAQSCLSSLIKFLEVRLRREHFSVLPYSKWS